jgi:hypothetical protein
VAHSSKGKASVIYQTLSHNLPSYERRMEVIAMLARIAVRFPTSTLSVQS